MPPNENDLGPLPRSDRPHQLEQLSIQALRQVLPPDQFQFRDERADDKGVDGSLELLIDGQFTNLRSQVQLKATDDESLNRDGSVSLSARTSNVNYLLNGSSPLYLLWIVPRQEMRFVWVRDEARRLHIADSEWMAKPSVTLRFVQTLSPAELQAIHDRILREGRLQRQTHDRMAAAALADRVIVSIDMQSLNVLDPDKVYEILVEGGLFLVAGGHGHEILGAMPALRVEQRTDARIQLVIAYAFCARADYGSAQGSLARASLREVDLDDEDRNFLHGLRASCEYHTGRIDIATYLETSERLSREAPPLLALQYDLESARLRHLGEQDPVERQKLYEELRGKVDAIVVTESASPAVKCHAELVKLYADTLQAHMEYIHEVGVWQMRARMDGLGGNNAAPVMQRVMARARLVMDDAERLLGLARDLRHPSLLAEALMIRAMGIIARLATVEAYAVDMKQAIPPLPAAVTGGVESDLLTAVQLFRTVENLEGEIRAQLFVADWMQITHRREEAHRIAELVVGAAAAMGYEVHHRRALDHMADTTDYDKLLAVARNPPDHDLAMAGLSDAELGRFGQDCLEAMGLPADRLSFVQNDCAAARAMAQERVQWCRHLEMIHDLEHTRSRRTMYASDAQKWCECLVHRYRSRIEATDWRPLVAAFKRAYCEGCPDRSAKGPGPGTTPAT